MNRNKLKGYMAEKDCTQRTLAAVIGISENTLSAKINGRIPFNTEEINAICLFLGINSYEDKCNIFLSGSSQK